MLFQLAEARREKYGSKSKKGEIGGKDWRKETIEDQRGETTGEGGGGKGGGEITRIKEILKKRSHEGKENGEQVHFRLSLE